MILLNLEILNNVIPATSNDDTRYYLKGVYIEDRDGFRHYTACDGHILFTQSEEIEGDALPRSIILGVTKPIKDKANLAELVLVDDTTAVLKTSPKTACDLVDTEYPDYRRIIPSDREVAKQYAQFEPEYMKKLFKFIPEAKGLAPFMEHRQSAALWEQGNKQAVIMPIRYTNFEE